MAFLPLYGLAPGFFSSLPPNLFFVECCPISCLFFFFFFKEAASAAPSRAVWGGAG